MAKRKTSRGRQMKRNGYSVAQARNDARSEIADQTLRLDAWLEAGDSAIRAYAQGDPAAGPELLRVMRSAGGKYSILGGVSVLGRLVGGEDGDSLIIQAAHLDKRIDTQVEKIMRKIVSFS